MAQHNLILRARPFTAPAVAAKRCKGAESAAFFQFIINFLYDLLFVTDFKITAQLHKLAENPRHVWVFRGAVLVQFRRKTAPTAPFAGHTAVSF